MKKIILWTLYAGFVGLLIFGAIKRTTTKLGENDGFQNSNTAEGEYVNGQTTEQNGNGYAQEKNASSQLNESTNYEEDTHEGQKTEHDWATLECSVSSITTRDMLVTTTDGQEILVSRRPWRFAQEQGFTAQVGDQLTLDGFYENGEFEIANITNLRNGQIVYLRDEAGHPLWATGGGGIGTE
ncbi:MAG: hypothetical protein U9O54_01550 [Chloroflexota bacterium]|nr:hypothetical protein [Chloroflexota bacterium]